MFTDRHEAGKKLAEKLVQYRGADAVVFALPRGGVVVGYDVAKALALPLDSIAVRKIGHPLTPEYAIGVVDEHGATIFNEAEKRAANPEWLAKEIEAQKNEAQRRSATYRGTRPLYAIAGKTAIIVDDGIATGLTMRLAVRAMKQRSAGKIVVAVPLAPPESLQALKDEGADEIVVLESPSDFLGAIGLHYVQFDQVEDDEVITLLRSADIGENIRVRTGDVVLEGTTTMPHGAKGLVVFVHGSGSSRFSPRNMFVAEVLQKAGIGTLLIDLLTKEEDAVYERRFDIDLLVKRLEAIIGWIKEKKDMKQLPIGLFGASTGAAAALRVAAQMGMAITAIVSRGGRPDLAMDTLPEVTAPTLLIVGGDDTGVIELNEQVFAKLQCEKKLEIVPGATHLFEEPGALENVAQLAQEWFVKFFVVKKI